MDSLRLEPARTRRDLVAFFRFPRRVYRGDPCRVEPILADRLAKVDPERNPFWRTADRQLWTAFRGRSPVGTIMAVHDHRGAAAPASASAAAPDGSYGTFGFFECLDDPEAARALVGAAARWLGSRGLVSVRGPYNPSPDDEPGILVEGFATLPAIMEAHNPPYYAGLLEAAGMAVRQEMYARLLERPPGNRPFLEDAAPRLRRAIEIARRRDRGVTVRRIDRARWDADIRTACRLFNAALAYLPGHVPVSEEEFLALAGSLRPILDDDLALLAEVDGRPAGFALALPDVNQALRYARGSLGPLGMARFLAHRRTIDRASFKIMMVAPEFQDRFVEVLVIARLGEELWRKGYRSVDLSMTGDENWKSNRIQERTGPRIYRRYRIYEARIPPAQGAGP